MFKLSRWLRKSYRPAIEANIRRTRWSDLSIPVVIADDRAATPVGSRQQARIDSTSCGNPPTVTARRSRQHLSAARNSGVTYTHCGRRGGWPTRMATRSDRTRHAPARGKSRFPGLIDLDPVGDLGYEIGPDIPGWGLESVEAHAQGRSMTPKHALWIADRRVGAAVRLICAYALGVRERRGLSLPVRDPPRAQLLRPSADDGLGRDAGAGVAWLAGCSLGLRFGFILLFAGSTWILARMTSSILRRQGRLPGGLGPQRHGLLRAGGLDVRLAGRAIALLLAADDRPIDRRTRRARNPPGCRPGSGWDWRGAGPC